MQSSKPSLGLGLAGLCLLHGSLYAAEPTWDCRIAADGRTWACSKDGQPVEDPIPSETPATTVTRPLALPVVPEPSPLKSPDTVPSEATDTTAPAARREPLTTDGPAEKEADEPATDSAVASPEPTTEARTQAPDPVPTPASPPLPVAPTTPKVVEPPQAETIAVEKPTPAPKKPPTATDEAALRALRGDQAMPDLLAPGPTTAKPIDEQPPPPVRRTEMTPPEPARTTVETPDAEETTAGALAFSDELDAGIDWANCGNIERDTAIESTRGADGETLPPLLVSADAAITELDPETAVFSGDVRLAQGGMQIDAAEVRLNRRTGEVDATGGFVLKRPDVRIAGDTAHYQLSTGQGEIEQARYRVPAIRARGDAAKAELLGDDKSRYHDINYSTCRPGQDDWLLTAKTLELDHVEGMGTARHATLRFMNVPMLYAPVFTFPIDDRRRSGVLIPSVGSSNNTGFDLSVPYYFNLAPNYDFTFTPRLMTKRGLLLGGEFRFLTEDSDGTLAAEFLPHDNEHDGDDNQRGSLSLTATKRFNARTQGNLLFNYVSDSDYLSDLGDSLAATSATHVERTGQIRYYGDTWDLLGRAQYYQTIDDSIAFVDRPYSRLPQLRVDLQNPNGVAGTTYHLDAEYVNFYRSDSVRGHRVDLFPAISLPLEKDWAYLEPKIGARYTAYRLTDQTAGLSDSPSTLSGLLSLDGGMLFDRPVQYFDNAATQTLEPRIYYLFVPDKNQDDQPIFDTDELDFNFDNLFRENRFNGSDRFGDANQLTLALSSRVLSSTTGTELLRASIGQIIYFEDRGVTLPGETIADDSSSALVGELAAALGSGWRTRAGLQWDPHDGDDGTIDQALAQIGYSDRDQRVFNAAYRLRDGVTQQTDLAAIWPLSEQVSLIGRHNYSLKDSRLLEALAGLEYGRCCWRLRALVRKFTDGDGDDHNLAFLIQLELNGLGRLGTDIDETLERGIYGYRTDD